VSENNKKNLPTKEEIDKIALSIRWGEIVIHYEVHDGKAVMVDVTQKRKIKLS